MIALVMATLLQLPPLPPQQADTSPFRPLGLPAPGVPRGFVVAGTDTGGTNITRLYLASHGGVPMPVPLRITFADGATKALQLPVEVWYRGNTYVYGVESPHEVTRVELDPEGVLPDVRGENDVWERPPRPPPAGRRRGGNEPT
jgi:hypothetical protein